MLQHTLFGHKYAVYANITKGLAAEEEITRQGALCGYAEIKRIRNIGGREHPWGLVNVTEIVMYDPRATWASIEWAMQTRMYEF